ncbi:ATP-grasp domain-containing protein [Idiomarina sp. Sol25]|uniref:ATP-grasp domain-containing protein n=1 Tax=Idiomarina sp. Sol25 TaxID=3064000 RepID=UPI00294B4C07|nr:ATP-grasp domain-containing protein [Idiomarina sp. Sol25]MDV6328046.1 ATP-grasp domain-containing protein [Idiomarina sp. Sol25]
MKDVAVVLGGTLPHVALIDKLKYRGYFVVLVDYLLTPPAKPYADMHIQASTLDPEVVLRIAVEYSAKLVISSCVDQANVTAALVSEKLGLPHAYSYEIALSATDKSLMKKKFVAGGIPSAKYQILDLADTTQSIEVPFPKIVKPADSNSSKGVRKVLDNEELENAASAAREISRNGKIVVEEFIEGTEVGADFIVLDGKVHYLTSKERLKIARSGVAVEQISGCIWPSPSLEGVKAKVVDAAQRIADEFELLNTPLMLQGIIRDNDFYVIEFGARLGGGESFRLVNQLSGVDYLELSIATWLGEKCAIEISESDAYYSDTFLYTSAGVISEINGLEEAKIDGLLEYYNLYKEGNTLMSGGLSSSDRLGVFVCKSKSLKELAELRRLILSRIEIVDSNAVNILRRDLYKFN